MRDFFFRIRSLDWVLNFSALFIAAASLLSLASINKNFFYRQLVWFSLGLIFIFVISQVDWRPFVNYRWVIFGIYALAVVLLAITYLTAPPIRGIKSWLVAGPFQLQISEFAKAALIIALSSFWAKAHIAVARIKNLLISFFYFIVPALLIVIQPDLGSVLVLFGIWFGYLLISGIKWRHLAIAVLIFFIAGIFLWTGYLKDYQKERIVNLFYPERNPLGVNYSVIQSKIAIGSAGFLGKGFKQGTQVQLGFLPEAKTDALLSVFIEEWGLLGGLLVIIAFLTVLIRIIFIGLASENNFSKLFCLGAVVMFLVHFVLNVGSNLGLTPVVGIPFPFLSYGGSHILMELAVIGIIQSIAARSR